MNAKKNLLVTLANEHQAKQLYFSVYWIAIKNAKLNIFKLSCFFNLATWESDL